MGMPKAIGIIVLCMWCLAACLWDADGRAAHVARFAVGVIAGAVASFALFAF